MSFLGVWFAVDNFEIIFGLRRHAIRNNNSKTIMI